MTVDKATTEAETASLVGQLQKQLDDPETPEEEAAEVTETITNLLEAADMKLGDYRHHAQ